MTDRLQRDVAEASRWLPAVLLLVAGATLTAVTPAFPVVTSADGSPSVAAVGTAWMAAFPLFLVLVATFVRTELGIAAAAGAGAIAIGRLLADLGLVLNPDAVLRPELFGVQNVSAFPLSPGWGAYVPLLADVLVVAGAGLAARTVLDDYEPPAFGEDGPGRVRAFTASPFTIVGLIAVVLVISSDLGVLYASPAPIVRPLGVADIGLFGAAGAAFGGLVLCLLVVVAAALPVVSARGLMLGAGAASAVPGLTVLFAGGDVAPSGLVWIGLVGAALLAVAGVLRRAPATDPLTDPGSAADEPESAVAPSGRAQPTTPEVGEESATPIWVSTIVGLLALAAAGCAVQAYLKPQATALLGNQGASFDAAGAGYLPAAVVLLICGIAAVVPRAGAWGRLALTVAWVPAVVAALTALEFTSSSIWLSAAVFTSAGGVQRSTGSGWGVAAAGLAMVAAIAAAVVSARIRDAADAELDPADDSDATARLRPVLGWALTALTLVTMLLPVFSANDRSSSALFVGGARVDTYGSWLSAVVLVAAAWFGVRQRRRSSMLVLLVAAAVVAGCRIALTPAVRHQLTFELRPGFYAGVVLALGFLGVAVALYPRIGRRAQPPPIVRPGRGAVSSATVKTSSSGRNPRRR